jgi:transcriptional regulator with XRE-family HTH domain
LLELSLRDRLGYCVDATSILRAIKAAQHTCRLCNTKEVWMPATKPQRQVQLDEFGELIKRKRQAEKLTLRDAETQLDRAITASSLSRIEHGAVPDARNVPRLAHWLGIPLEQVVWPETGEEVKAVDTPSAVEVHLRADRNLDPKVAQALADMFRKLYESASEGGLIATRERKRKR